MGVTSALSTLLNWTRALDLSRIRPEKAWDENTIPRCRGSLETQHNMGSQRLSGLTYLVTPPLAQTAAGREQEGTAKADFWPPHLSLSCSTGSFQGLTSIPSHHYYPQLFCVQFLCTMSLGLPPSSGSCSATSQIPLWHLSQSLLPPEASKP